MDAAGTPSPLRPARRRTGGSPSFWGGLFSSLVSYDPYSVVWEHIRVSRLLLFPLELIFFLKKRKKAPKKLRNVPVGALQRPNAAAVNEVPGIKT